MNQRKGERAPCSRPGDRDAYIRLDTGATGRGYYRRNLRQPPVEATCGQPPWLSGGAKLRRQRS
jgi:hypothetical protein